MGTLKAKVDGNWVPLEFSGGPNPQNALGIVSLGSLLNATGTGNSIPAAATKITTPIAFTTIIGRRYRLVVKVRAIVPNAGAGFFRTVVYDNNVDSYTTYGDHYTWIASNYSTHRAEYVFNGDGVAHSFEIAAVNNVAFTIYTNFCFFCLEDIGPNASPALPLPPTPQAWTALPLQGSWRAEVAGIQAPQYRMIGDVVTLRGTAELITATSPANSNLAVMPAGFRPSVMTRFSSGAHRSNVGGMTHVRMHLQPDGILVVNELIPAMADPVVYLNDISFSVTP